MVFGIGLLAIGLILLILGVIIAITPTNQASEKQTVPSISNFWKYIILNTEILGVIITIVGIIPLVLGILVLVKRDKS